MSGVVGSASSPTSSGAGHARRPVAAQRSLRRRLCHRRLPTAVLGLDHRAFRRANIHCLGPRCTWWDLLVFHRCERTPHCVEAHLRSIHLHCLGLGLLLVPQPLHPLRALREQELEEAAATGEHASEDLRRATAGLRRCGLAAALQQVCCSFCAPFWRWASDFLRRLRFSAAAPVGGPLRPNGRAPARPAPLHRLLSLQPPHNCAGALARTVSTMRTLAR